MLNAALGAIGTLADAGGVARVAQGRQYQKENVSWIRRNYILDTQAMRLDLLSSAKDEIRAHYETYLTRLDTLLLVTALLWPFGLASLQFSDEFVPLTEEDCSYCVEATHPWLISIWVWLVGIILFLPMWACTLLIRCKLKLDSWLKLSLASLNQERRTTLTALNGPAQILQDGQQDPLGVPKAETAMSEELHKDMEEVVKRLGGFIVQYQDQFSHVWNVECGGQVRLATALLGFDAIFALLLTALMFWIYLVNRSDTDGNDIPNNFYGTGTFLAVIILVGLLCPFIYIFGSWCVSSKTDMEDGGGGFTNLITPQAATVKRENSMIRESGFGDSSVSGSYRDSALRGSGVVRRTSGNIPPRFAPPAAAQPALASTVSSGMASSTVSSGSILAAPGALAPIESHGSFQDANSFEDALSFAARPEALRQRGGPAEVAGNTNSFDSAVEERS